MGIAFYVNDQYISEFDSNPAKGLVHCLRVREEYSKWRGKSRLVLAACLVISQPRARKPVWRPRAD